MKRDQSFQECLYFSLNIFTRKVNELADEAFGATGLSPSHAFMLMTVIDNPGIKPVEIAEKLNLAPSTITRFIDRLEAKKLLRREPDGHQVRIWPTNEGTEMNQKLDESWDNLYNRMTALFGENDYQEMVATVCRYSSRFE